MAYQDVVDFHAANKEELSVLNKRMQELRGQLEFAFAKNGGCSDLWSEYYENDYESEKVDLIIEIANDFGMGVSEDGDFLWQPSTRDC